MAYDIDGSTLYFYDSNNGAITILSGTSVKALNDESDSTSLNIGGSSTSVPIYYGVLFPELRNINGYYIVWQNEGGNQPPNQIQYSTNTNNGADGTWTNYGAAAYQGSTQPYYRSNIASMLVSGVKAVRFNLGVPIPFGWSYNLYTFHLYGQQASGANPDSLRIYNAAGTAELSTVLDEGDIAQSAVATTGFTVANTSSTKTATTITVSCTALTDASPSLIPQFTLSSDGGSTYHSSITISSLAPGAVSSVLYVQDTVSSTAETSVWALRMIASAASFT
jgi:hypothetical protein